MLMSEGTALTHLCYNLNIKDLAKQFQVVFPAEWFANRMAKDRGEDAPNFFESPRMFYLIDFMCVINSSGATSA